MTVLSTIVISLEGFARGESDSPAIGPVKPFIHKGTCCVLCVDFEHWASTTSDNVLADLVKLDPSARGASYERRLSVFQNGLPEIRRLGVLRGWLTFGIDDLLSGGTLLVLGAEKGADRQSLLASAQNVAPAVAMRRNEVVAKTSVWVKEHEVAIGGSERIVERYSNVTPAARPDLLEPLAELMDGGALTAVVLSFDRDTRRVLRELWPTSLPAPLDKLTGATFADDVRWIGAELRDKPRPLGRLMIELRDEPTAAALLTWIDSRVELLVSEAPQDTPRREETMKRMASALQPRREGSRIVLDLEPDGDQVGALQALITPLVKSVQDARTGQSVQPAE